MSKGINTGEDGKLGSDTRAVFEVVANDDPNGRFLFAESSRSVDIPEDFNPGMQSETERNLTVLRGQGAWGRVEVSIHYRCSTNSAFVEVVGGNSSIVCTELVRRSLVIVGRKRYLQDNVLANE